MVFGSLNGRALASIETNVPFEGVMSKLPLSGSDETRTLELEVNETGDSALRYALAITAHQGVTYLTDRARSLVFVLVPPVSPKSRSHDGVCTPPEARFLNARTFSNCLSVTVRSLGLADRDQNAGSV